MSIFSDEIFFSLSLSSSLFLSHSPFLSLSIRVTNLNQQQEREREKEIFCPSNILTRRVRQSSISIHFNFLSPSFSPSFFSFFLILFPSLSFFREKEGEGEETVQKDHTLCFKPLIRRNNYEIGTN